MTESEIRWAVNHDLWCPTDEQFDRCLTLAQEEEQARIRRFVFRRDAKASLVGRLLIRRLFRDLLQVSNDGFRLARTEKNKPYLVLEGLSDKQRDLVRGWNFNVSHSGSWTVLAASNSRLIGVDVQKIEISGIDKDEERFFVQLESVFNRTEWATIRSSHSHRLASFFHFWTLKESYIKAVGVGLQLELERIQFKVERDLSLVHEEVEAEQPPRVPRELYRQASVVVDRTQQDGWLFEQFMLDLEHVAAVARGPFEHGDFEYLSKLHDPPTSAMVPALIEPVTEWRVLQVIDLLPVIACRF